MLALTESTACVRVCAGTSAPSGAYMGIAAAGRHPQEPTLAFDAERVSIKQGNTDARVRVVAAPDVLPTRRKAKKDERLWVFVNSFGRNWTSSGFRASWHKEMEQLGIEGVPFHDLGATAIT